MLLFSFHSAITPKLDSLVVQNVRYDVALLCGHEMAVPDGLPRCVRILILWNTEKRQDEILHVYLREAQSLRPDRSEIPPIPWEEIEAAINGTITQVEAPP